MKYREIKIIKSGITGEVPIGVKNRIIGLGNAETYLREKDKGKPRRTRWAL